MSLEEDSCGGEKVDALMFELGGGPNGVFREKRGGLYCPMGPLEAAAEEVHGGGKVEFRFFNWLNSLRDAGLLKTRSLPGLILWEVFHRYQTEPEFKRCILDAVKREILTARERASVLYLAGHSLGAAIICEALKELLQEKRLSKKEGEYLYLVLLSPALGPVMEGRLKANMSTYELGVLNSGLDGAMELRVPRDLLSAPTPWADSELVRLEVPVPFHVLGRTLDRLLATCGHTLATSWGESRIRGQFRQWSAERTVPAAQPNLRCL